MKKVIFCEIAWMKQYSGVTEDDKPRHGGKYVDENNDGGEVYNFLPWNHYCYGYVMHYGSELHIERYDKITDDFSEMRDVTVVWVATDGSVCKIVGWYEHATMYRYWQQFFDTQNAGDYSFDHNFKAHEKDCYLIREDKRSFVVPRATIAGKGRGMGQSQVWYADSQYAQEVFVPEVQEYLERAKKDCVELFLQQNVVNAVAEDKGVLPDELRKNAVSAFKDGNAGKAISLINLAIHLDDNEENHFCRGQIFSMLALYDEAEKDLKTALFYKEKMETLGELFYVTIMLRHYLVAIEIGEKIRARKEEDEEWNSNSGNLIYCYLCVGELDKAEELMNECEIENVDTPNMENFRAWLQEEREAMK